ncbi:virulence factor family protein [Rhizobium halophytocola]|uniref:Type IV secretory pathway VirJ component n=1 Tax=Rhizobium halophytocola TaxID=735519 RepID=A0ABS4DX28_9HYPH|nr:virulence factor family protein [Rhizobium halophytocola]MBP1850245.1 type IV secretory pathway VirJ component [Rhizobium halophytocola]
MKFLSLAALAAVTFASVSPMPAPRLYDTVSLPTDRIIAPGTSAASSVIILLSSGAGWTARETMIAGRWTRQGAIVVGVDLPKYYAAIARETRDCHYLVSDIERLARQIHRRFGLAAYHPPVVAGLEEGGTLALAIAAQTPVSTISATLAADPGEIVPLEKPLCTPAMKQKVDGGRVYGLTKGALPDPVTVILSKAATPAAARHAKRLKKSHPAVAIAQASDGADAALAYHGVALMARQAARTAPLDLPLVELVARPRFDTMAIVYSGDGGWRDIDRKLGLSLQQGGVPVIGIDALRYFWSQKTPGETAADLSDIIAVYRARFGVSRVALIGYSFGADILPATYGRLSNQDKQAVTLVSLLAPSRRADFEISVGGWLGFAGDGRHGDPVEDALAIRPDRLQCVYGAAELQSGCLGLASLERHGMDLVERPGGHHFDGNYALIAERILDRLRPR